MAYSGFPRIVNPDFSPSQDIMSYQEPFDKNYLGEDYAANPDYSLSTFFDTESFFDPPLTSADPNTSQGFQAGPNPHLFNPTLPPTGFAASTSQIPPRQIALPTPLGQISPYQHSYPLESPSLETIEPSTFSPATYTTSRTPSLCGDFAAPPQITTAATTTTTSPYPVKLESPSTPTSPASQATTTGSTPAQRPQRKRGRPRLSRSNSTSDQPSNSASSSKHAKTTPTSGRLPHNQVERKYREGLNSELERLRKAVPTLPQSSDAGEMGAAKPSKAMVLSGAIEYIRKVERERDELQREVEALRRERKARGWEDDDGMGWLGE